MSTFVNESKNSASFSLENKNSSSFSMLLKHGKDMPLENLENLTFTDEPFNDGRQLKDFTFEELGNQQWSLESKN